MTKETKTMKVPNPYSDSTEELLCRFELFFHKGKLKGACLEAIISEGGINLMEWLKPERTEEIEDDFLVAYDG